MSSLPYFDFIVKLGFTVTTHVLEKLWCFHSEQRTTVLLKRAQAQTVLFPFALTQWAYCDAIVLSDSECYLSQSTIFSAGHTLQDLQWDLRSTL